jgi:hypothetical protein
MTYHCTPLIAIVGLFSLTACETARVDKKDEPKPPTESQMTTGARPFGVIDQVKRSEKFVIISATGPVPDAPATLCTRNFGADETSRLRLSPERKSTLLTADIISGDPGVGDMVFVHQSMSDDTPASATTSPKPAAKKKKTSVGTNPIGPDTTPEPLSPIEKIPEPSVELGPDPTINANQMPDGPQ